MSGWSSTGVGCWPLHLPAGGVPDFSKPKRRAHAGAGISPAAFNSGTTSGGSHQLRFRAMVPARLNENFYLHALQSAARCFSVKDSNSLMLICAPLMAFSHFSIGF